MNRWESWLLHISTLVLSVTGIAYAWMHYMMKPMDLFSVVNHPLEPAMLSIHILVAPLLLLGFGIIVHSHILFKVGTGTQTARRSGLVLIPTFVVMVISGYLLQVITSDFRKILVIAHLSSGIIWSALYIAHQVASYAQRRAKPSGRPRYRIPVQVVLLSIFLGAAPISMATGFERQVYSMGTTLRVVMLEENQQKAIQDSEKLIRVIEETDNQLSTWKSTSELSRLNREPAGKPLPVSSELFSLLEKLQGWTFLTHGAFDPGIGRLLEIWGVHKTFRIPANDEISNAKSRSGLRYIDMDSSGIAVTKKKDILIDPGAFGKGEALDRALKLATSNKMGPLLMDFGGQIAVYGIPKEEAGWQAMLARPEDRSAMEKEKLLLKSGSLSTSGFSERSGKIGDQTVNHILNPETGFPVKQFGSVTVWHSQALIADILSTALYVMGPDAGYDWAVKNNFAAAFIVNNKILKTPEFNRVFQQ